MGQYKKELIYFTIVPDNSPLEPGESYSAFYYAQVNDDVALTTSWYSAVTTQPSSDGGKTFDNF